MITNQKMTEIGIFPLEWNIVKLGSLLEFQNGVNADKSSYGHGTPFINVLEVINHSHIHTIAIPGRVSLSKRAVESFVVRKGDIVFNRTSETQEEVGLASVFMDDDVVVFGGFVIRGRPKTFELQATYSGYALRSSVVRAQIISKGQGAIRANIGQADLSQIFVPLPPPAEQRRIAEVLSDVDAQISALDALIAKKRDIKKGVMQELLTGRRRLPGFSGEWEDTSLGAISRHIVGGGTPSRVNPSYWGNEIPWVTVKDFATFDPYGTQEAITLAGLINSASTLIPQGTLITATRMAIGKAIIYKVDCAINQDLKAIFLAEDVDPNFVYYWFQLYEKMIAQLGSGSTVTGISLETLRGLRFLKPSFREQIAISGILGDIDLDIVELRKRREKTTDLKQAMMQELLTGKTRLT